VELLFLILHLHLLLY
jgi:hypothetical protein